jgi:thiol-disulfide isomerase/thioredoxin
MASIAFVFIFGTNETEENSELVLNNLPHDSEIILYYADNCPLCEEIKEWITENKIDEKIEIIQKEVEKNQENNSQLLTVAKKCGFEENINIPLVYAEGACLTEKSEIINYLENKLGEQ